MRISWLLVYSVCVGNGWFILTAREIPLPSQFSNGCLESKARTQVHYTSTPAIISLSRLSHSFVPSLDAEQNFEENRQFNLYRKTMESLGNNGCFWVIVSTLFSVLVIFLAVSSLTRPRPSPRIPAQSRLL